MGQNQKTFSKILRIGAFAQHTIFDFYQRAFGDFLEVRAHFDFRHGAFAHFYVHGHLPILGAKNGVCILHPKFFNFEFGGFCPFLAQKLESVHFAHSFF